MKHAKIALLGRISSTKVQMKPFMMMKAIARSVPLAKQAYILGKQWVVCVKPATRDGLLLTMANQNASSAQPDGIKIFQVKVNAKPAAATTL
jgi:hypothetical protein